MIEYWDNKFREVKTMWGMEPSDSAMLVKDFFIKQQIHDILIPGVGYGRNANVFIKHGIKVTGIEISEYAISMAKNEYKLDFPIYQGSVTNMPYDNKSYEGIYCYALIHLLNKNERKQFIKNCFNQLQTNGFMIFVSVSQKSSMYGNGRLLSDHRYELMRGLKVYFYDMDSAAKEFINYGLIDVHEFDEPIKHMDNQPPLKCIMIKCHKT